jgi:hypothetical protein
MNRLVGVYITQNSRNPRISNVYKLYAFYYFYIVVLSVSVCQKNKKIKYPNNKKEIYNDKYRHTRDRLFGLGVVQLVTLFLGKYSLLYNFTRLASISTK